MAPFPSLFTRQHYPDMWDPTIPPCTNPRAFSGACFLGATGFPRRGLVGNSVNSAFPSPLVKASTHLVTRLEQDASHTYIGEGLAGKQKGRSPIKDPGPISSAYCYSVSRSLFARLALSSARAARSPASGASLTSILKIRSSSLVRVTAPSALALFGRCRS